MGLKPSRHRRLRRQLRQRDGDDCHLCRAPMVFNNHESDLYATIDHVLPRSAGGRHDLENLKLAHRRCNQRRGNGPVLRMGWE